MERPCRLFLTTQLSSRTDILYIFVNKFCTASLCMWIFFCHLLFVKRRLMKECHFYLL